jgi:hypothetical protein
MELFENFDTHRKRHHMRLIGEGKSEDIFDFFKDKEASIFLKDKDASVAIGLFYNENLFYVLTKNGSIFFLIKESKKVAFVRGESSIQEAWSFIYKNLISGSYSNGTYNALEYPLPQEIVNQYEAILQKYKYDILEEVYKEKQKYLQDEVINKYKTDKKYDVGEYGFTIEQPSVDIMKLFYHPFFKDYAEREDVMTTQDGVKYFENDLKKEVELVKEYEPELEKIEVESRTEDGVKFFEEYLGRKRRFKLIKGRVMMIGGYYKFYEKPKPVDSSFEFVSYSTGKEFKLLNRAQERQRQIEKESREKWKKSKE